MTRLEDELRQTFADRVTTMPQLHDIAGTALARGRAVRRRQRVTVGAAFAVVIALVASGAWWVRGVGVDSRRTPQGTAAASRTAAAQAPTLDLVVGGELRPAGRAPIALPGSGDVYDALRVPDGWLVVRGDKSTHELWRVRADGTSTLLLPGLRNAYAFSADGKRLAYQQGSELTVAVLAAKHDLTSISLPGRDGDQGRTGAELVGWAGRYVVIGNRQGNDYDGFDVWDPADHAYTPTWNHEVVGVYAATPDGRSVIGVVKDARAGSFCAAVLDPADGLRTISKVCGQPYLSAYRHGLSPDGTRFLAQAPGGVGIAASATGALTATVAVAQGGWPAEPTWLDNNTFVVPDDGHILSVDATDPAHPRQLPAPSTTEHWFVVARPTG